MGSETGELGPISLQFKRHLPFGDNAGKKDREGNPINLTLYDGRILTPNRPEFFKLSRMAVVRPDDVFVCGYVKTGCHWIWETLNMIQKGRGVFSEMGKGQGFLEFSGPELYNSLPSPRILNTHNEFDWLPEKEHTSCRFTLLHMDNGDYFDYHLNWLKAIKDNPDHPFLILKYEDAIEDFPAAIRQLAEFIESPLTEDQVQDIAESISFKSMKKRFEALPTSKLIRKGEVGDWRNWLTDEQSAELERRNRTLKGTQFETRCEL